MLSKNENIVSQYVVESSEVESMYRPVMSKVPYMGMEEIKDRLNNYGI